MYSLDTPPGTKIKIKGNVEVANGFLLLSNSSVDVLGGRVEGLLKKWRTTKASYHHFAERERIFIIPIHNSPMISIYFIMF